MSSTLTLATRYHCTSSLESVHCVRNATRKASKCRHCGGRIRSDQGRFGVFTWTGDGRYPADFAHRTFVRADVADRWANETNEWYVVRWIPADALAAGVVEKARRADIAKRHIEMHGQPSWLLSR